MHRLSWIIWCVQCNHRQDTGKSERLTEAEIGVMQVTSQEIPEASGSGKKQEMDSFQSFPKALGLLIP